MTALFAHLHVHSHYSLQWGVSSVRDLCRTAAEAGYSFLALTDTNGLYGALHFLEAAREEGICPIVGVDFRNGGETAVVLAKTAKGFEVLSEMVSCRHLDPRFSLCRHVSAVPDDLAVLARDPELLRALVPRADCYVEVIPGYSEREALRSAGELGVPPVASNAVYFARVEDHPLHRLVRAIGLNKTLSTLTAEEVVGPDRWLKPPRDMAARFSHCPEALRNAWRLARRCRTDWDRFEPVFPCYPCGERNSLDILVERCREGIGRRYGKSDPAVEARLSEELELIVAKGYVDYFLVVADIVKERPIHCGRGSAAASLVSYLLGITHVDPIRHGLLFGRFLNPERKDPPDIDVDFPWDEREDVQQSVRRRYGDERTARVANHVGFGARAAVRETAKVYGVAAAEIREVTRRLSYWTHPSGIEDRTRNHPRFQGFPLDPPWPEIFRLAARLESIPRHLAVHCGGVVLTPDRVSRHAPVQRSAGGVPIIQWEKDQAEKAGLVKIDLLGNRSLAVIRDALAAVARNTGKTIDYAALDPVEDPATRDLLARGDTMGIFYVESPAMRQLQRKTGRGDFEHLVIHSSIIRPAANRYINEYVHRLRGEPHAYTHPALERLLSETYGILVYQEDVIQVAMGLAGFSWAEGDRLRKVISKKSSEVLGKFRQRFFEGCGRRGVSPEVAGTVWDMFLSFAGYSFCKPHSASYALVSFKAAYLKVHHPAEFMAAVLSNGGGYYSTFAYISEARRMGLDVVGPDVNGSDWSYTGKDRTVRVGLQQIRGVRRETLERILDERGRNGPFTSLADFQRRAPCHPSDVAGLIKSGTLDSLAGGLNRPRLLWAMATGLHRRTSRSEGPPAQMRAPLRPPGASLEPAAPALPDFTLREKWIQERDALGFVLSVHPLALWDGGWPHLVVPAAKLEHFAGRRVWVKGWPITRKEVLTRDGEPMEFVSFEDESAIYETIFFPGAFRRFCRDLVMERAYRLYGEVESEFGAVHLNVQRFHVPAGVTSSPQTPRPLRAFR